jgi:hypothetical protein
VLSCTTLPFDIENRTTTYLPRNPVALTCFAGSFGRSCLLAEAFGFFGKFLSSELAGNDKPPNLACTRPDFVELGIPPKLLDREF